LQKEMGRLFECFGGEGPKGGAYPPMNLWSNDTEAVVTAELPGVDASELDISVLRDQLTIRGERKQDELPEGTIRHRTEQVHGPFTRTLQLPFEVEDDKVQASYHLGVLRLTFPRAEATRPRKIEIEPETD
jgi:HSP20 family protein